MLGKLVQLVHPLLRMLLWKLRLGIPFPLMMLELLWELMSQILLGGIMLLFLLLELLPPILLLLEILLVIILMLLLVLLVKLLVLRVRMLGIM